MGRCTSTALLAALVPLTVVIADTVWRIVQNRIKGNGHPLPPGPVPLPLIGSVLYINAKMPWLTYTGWRAKYGEYTAQNGCVVLKFPLGDIVYVRLLDMDVIVLNSSSVAARLLDKRSRIYSDRPFIETIVP